MLAFFLALRDAADWTARQIQAAMSLMFGSALLLAFVNATIILLSTGEWMKGSFMNMGVAIVDSLWLILTFVAFHMNTGLITKAGLITYRETRRFMMGYVDVEAATGIFFILVPIPPLFLFPLLLCITMWYFSAEMMDRKFNWNKFRVPAIWATAIILLIGLGISLGFYKHSDIKDPSKVAPKITAAAESVAGAVATSAKATADADTAAAKAAADAASAAAASAATPPPEKNGKTKLGSGEFSINPDAKIPPKNGGWQKPTASERFPESTEWPIPFGEKLIARVYTKEWPAWIKWVINGNGQKHEFFWPKQNSCQPPYCESKRTQKDGQEVWEVTWSFINDNPANPVIAQVHLEYSSPVLETQFWPAVKKADGCGWELKKEKPPVG